MEQQWDICWDTLWEALDIMVLEGGVQIIPGLQEAVLTVTLTKYNYLTYENFTLCKLSCLLRIKP